MTGREAGYCAGSDNAGHADPSPGRGGRFGFGVSGGRGRGRRGMRRGMGRGLGGRGRGFRFWRRDFDE